MDFHKDYSLAYDESEVSKCLLCHDPVCTKMCPQHVPCGEILKALYFENYCGAIRLLGNANCTHCNSPCEKNCVLSGTRIPVKIREVLMAIREDASVLPPHRIEDVDLSTDICGVRLENPFLLSSSVVASTYDMCRRAFRQDGQELLSRLSAASRSTRHHRGSLRSEITRMLSAVSRTLNSSLTTALKRIWRYSNA